MFVNALILMYVGEEVPADEVLPAAQEYLHEGVAAARTSFLDSNGDSRIGWRLCQESERLRIKAGSSAVEKVVVDWQGCAAQEPFTIFFTPELRGKQT